MNTNASTPTQTGLSDLAYDLVTVLSNKAKGARAYEAYIEDARRANATECAQLLERLWKEDQRQIEELKQHIEVVLGDESGSPGSPGSPIQGQGQRQARS